MAADQNALVPEIHLCTAGNVGIVEGMVARFRAELGADMRVIGTGGLVGVIAKETDVIEIVNPWLTLEGLRLVWAMNQ